MNDQQNLVWIDLEMTGLNPHSDTILEIATIITNGQLTTMVEGPHLVIHQPENLLESMDDWVKETHINSGLIDLVRKSNISLKNAEEQTFDFIAHHCQAKSALLAGNSVWKDKEFLVRYMPRITDYLHYRIIDVSSIKELVKYWYKGNPYTFFEKQEGHRALDDIRDSIAELKHYRRYFFVSVE